MFGYYFPSNNTTPLFIGNTSLISGAYNQSQSHPESVYNMGQVVTTKYVTLYIQNGCKSSMTVTGFTYLSADGIEIINNVSVPFTLNPFTEQRLLIAVTPEGASPFDSRIIVNTSVGDKVLRFYGTRIPKIDGSIYAPVVRPERGLQEAYKWNTNVMVSMTGYEQSVGHRPTPEHTIICSYILANCDLVQFESGLSGHKTDYVFMPLWGDSEILPCDALAGTPSIKIKTEGKRLYRYGYVMLVDNKGNSEYVQVDTIGGEIINLVEPVQQNYYKGLATVIPIAVCFPPEQVKINRYSSTTAKVDATFTEVKPYEFPPTYVPEYHGSYQVFPLRAHTTGNKTDTLSHRWKRLDTGNGFLNYYKQDDTNIYQEEINILLDNREDISVYISFLHNVYGKLKMFWFPYYYNSMILNDNSQAGQNMLTIKHANYTLFRSDDWASENLQIEYNDGTIFRTKIVDSEQLVVGGEETLALTEPLPQETNKATVKIIRFLRLCRLNSDNITIEWLDTGMLKSKLPVISIKPILQII